LLGSGRAADARLTDKSGDRNAVHRIGRHFEQLFKKVPSPQISNAIREAPRRRRLKDNILLPHKDKTNLGISKGPKDELVLDMTRFGVFAAQKLPAGRQIVEE